VKLQGSHWCISACMQMILGNVAIYKHWHQNPDSQVRRKKFRKREFPHLVLPLLPSLAPRLFLPVTAEACKDGTPKPMGAEPHRRWMPWPAGRRPSRSRRCSRAGHDSLTPKAQTHVTQIRPNYPFTSLARLSSSSANTTLSLSPSLSMAGWPQPLLPGAS
jgi:hypothetical protein